MPIIHTFKTSWPVGAKPLSMEQWAATLSTAEQDEFTHANLRQKAFRAQVIEDGKMVLGHDTYTWADKEAADINKPNDPIWLLYWDRYLLETKAICTMEVTEI